MRAIPVFIITALVMLVCSLGNGLASAQVIKETTFVKRNGSTIVVRTMAPVDVIEVEPYIDAKKGKDSGSLSLEVVIKNTAAEPRSYQLFGQGKTKNGGWLGGAAKAPDKGRLDPGKQATAKVKTSFEGKAVPEQIRLDVF
jgi:hypothetical protein